jgi:hypothetical protein
MRPDQVIERPDSTSLPEVVASTDATGAPFASEWVGAEASAVAESVPVRRRLPLSLIIWGVILAGVVIASAVFNASRNDEGDITKAGDLQITDLRVGDCFDLKDPAADLIEDVKAVPCTQEHEYELFHIASLSANGYPTDAAFTTFIESECLPAFETFVGLAYDDSELDMFPVVPTKDAWDDGDRAIQCAVFHPRIHRLTESQKGSAR